MNTVNAAALRRPWLTLAGFLVLLIVAGSFGTRVFSRLGGVGLDDPNSESVLGGELLETAFDAGSPDVVVLITAADGDVDSVASTEAALQLIDELSGLDQLDDLVSYWTAGNLATLRSIDGSEALVAARVRGDQSDPERPANIDEVFTLLSTPRDGLVVQIGGADWVAREITSTAKADLTRAEMIALPLTLLALIVVFRGVTPALLGVGVGVAAIIGSLFILFLSSFVVDISVFAINLVTVLGLGLAIDYSLLIISRFRLELGDGRAPHDAAQRTVETAGRTVLFSSCTVAISLATLVVFPLPFLRSFAFAGVAVVAAAAMIAVLVLPAVMVLLARRLQPRNVRTPTKTASGSAIVDFAIRRRVATVVIGIGVLALIGTPFLDIRLGVPDDRVLAEGSPARAVPDALRTRFASADTNAFAVVIEGAGTIGEIDRYALQISALDSVARVESPAGGHADGVLIAPSDERLATYQTPDMIRIDVIPSVDPISAEAETLVAEIRALENDIGTTYVTGATAALVDTKAAVAAKVPLTIGLISLATFILLYRMFGSVLVPLKAILLNVLSLTATFGMMVWVFQSGNGADLLGFEATGFTDATTPILMFCIAFGLSMDYEVFLLAGIREAYDETHDTERAVRLGIARTRRVINASAAVMAITFLAFATSSISFIKLFGLGLATAVLVDAFVVRTLIVPALMVLAGPWNWWKPRLRRTSNRLVSNTLAVNRE